MDTNIPDDVIADLGLVIPPEKAVEKIYEHATELAELDNLIDTTEKELRRLKDDYHVLTTKTLPALFDQVRTDNFGVPGWQADVKMKTIVKANISKEWEVERQERGYEELERVGGGSLVKVSVSVQFPKGDLERANEFFDYVERWNRLEGAPIVMEKTVAWNTLTKFVKEQLIEKLKPFDAEKLGATLVRACEIVWRKDRHGSTIRERSRAVGKTFSEV